MKIKVNDNVLVIAGAYKGKTGKVLKTFASTNKVVVEGINIAKKHTKPRTNEDKGGIFDIEMPIHVSNVKLIDKKEAKKETKTTKETKAKSSTTKKATKKASK